MTGVKTKVLQQFPQAYAYRYAGDSWGIRTAVDGKVLGQTASTQMGAWRKAWDHLCADQGTPPLINRK